MKYRHSRNGQVLGNLIGLALFVFMALWWMSPDRRRNDREVDVDRAAEIEREITPPAAVEPREGIAAVLLLDVSGSMADEVSESGSGQKIDIARRAAMDLLGQFDRYAKAHPDEPVIVGLFEFSGDRDRGRNTREVIPLEPPNLARAEEALARMTPQGGTPIGDALVVGKRALDRTGFTRRHLLVVTDGENTEGYRPADVMAALMRRPERERPSVYFVAFDIAAARFEAVKNAGGLVLAAANAQELADTLDFLLTGKILVEGQ
ncbi:MAG TPA: vWA domain-containing protein [Vicinamibacterales bacterium]